KSLESVIEIQSQYAKKAYDTWVAQASKLGEMYAAVARCIQAGRESGDEEGVVDRFSLYIKEARRLRASGSLADRRRTCVKYPRIPLSIRSLEPVLDQSPARLLTPTVATRRSLLSQSGARLRYSPSSSVRPMRATLPRHRRSGECSSQVTMPSFQ